MDFREMKTIEPELGRLEDSARNAGRHAATWVDVLFAVHEPLSKLVGRGAVREELQTSQAYETARRGLFEAWGRGVAETYATDVQQAFISTSEVYR